MSRLCQTEKGLKLCQNCVRAKAAQWRATLCRAVWCLCRFRKRKSLLGQRSAKFGLCSGESQGVELPLSVSVHDLAFPHVRTPDAESKCPISQRSAFFLGADGPCWWFWHSGLVHGRKGARSKRAITQRSAPLGVSCLAGIRWPIRHRAAVLLSRCRLVLRRRRLVSSRLLVVLVVWCLSAFRTTRATRGCTR